MVVCSFVFIDKDWFAQYNFTKSEIFEFQKKEFNWGLHYNAGNEREETRTDIMARI